MSNSKFIVIAAPSGSGKTTIVNKLLKEKNLNLSFSVSATSRAPRNNEVDGLNYFFLSKDEFIKKYVLAMSPFHFKGGVARSNIYYHGLKNYAQSSAKEVGILLNGKNRGEFNEEEDKFFIKSRTKYVNAIKELFLLFREMLENEEGSEGYTKQ